MLICVCALMSPGRTSPPRASITLSDSYLAKIFVFEVDGGDGLSLNRNCPVAQDAPCFHPS